MVSCPFPLSGICNSKILTGPETHYIYPPWTRTHYKILYYYWILYYSFLSPQKLKNVEEIIEALRPHIRDISFSTYYRLRKAAVEALSSVLWGFSAQDTLKTLDCFFPPDV